MVDSGEVVGWQPIETAPKHTFVLIAYKNRRYTTSEKTITVAMFTGHEWFGQPTPNPEIKHEYALHMYAENPTHWMPLPKAPE